MATCESWERKERKRMREEDPLLMRCAWNLEIPIYFINNYYVFDSDKLNDDNK